MKKTIWTFGLIAGAIMSTMMVVTIPFVDSIGSSTGEIIGYTSMVLAFLLVFFGIRSYRENVGAGTISFGRAFSVGLLISAIASLCYVATWEVLYYKVYTDFDARMVQASVDQARKAGKSDAEVAQVRARNEAFVRSYHKPLVNMAYTFVEPFPVGLIVSLVSAGILRRKRRGAGDASLVAA